MKKPPPPPVVIGRVYRVIWKNGNPHIQAGQLLATGKQQKARASLFDGERFSGYTAEPTMQAAIERELIECADKYGHGFGFQNKRRPWSLVYTVTRLWRLYRKLQKHGLVPHDGLVTLIRKEP